MTNRPNHFWTPERDRQLAELWGRELRCSIIALMIGAVSDRAVISRAFRLELPRRKRGWKTGRRRPAAASLRALKEHVTRTAARQGGQP
jgi:hypothetical protein